MASSIPAIYHDSPELSSDSASNDYDPESVIHGRVGNLGWTESQVNKQLAGGISNVELWKLRRRFNKQIYHVKATDEALPGGLDLNIAFTPQDDVSADKINFRADIERLYLTVLINLLGTVKHIQRLRSWRETRRTACFASAYFLAWSVDLIGLLLSLALTTLIIHPPFRVLLFPPAPLAIVDAATGGPQKPAAGVLGSTDTATGAPEHHGGEAAEQEASSFVTGFIAVAVSGLGGAHADAGPHETQEESGQAGASSAASPDPTALAKAAADAKNAAAGGEDEVENDKTKVPMETVLWAKTKPVMRAVESTCDMWERFANALSPTPPFPPQTHQLRLAALVLPLVVASVALDSYWLGKTTAFLAGFLFFGKPAMARAAVLLDCYCPRWREELDLRNNVLRGVPTNAQLTLALLRVGEAANSPLPPAPKGDGEPPEEPVDLTEEGHLGAAAGDEPLGADEAELAETAARNPEALREASGEEITGADGAEQGRKTSKALRIIKGVMRRAVKTAIAVEDVRAKVTHSRVAQDHLGVAEKPANRRARVFGPVSFEARESGRMGRAYIAMSGRGVGMEPSPCLVFSTDEKGERGGNTLVEVGVDECVVWRLLVSDIVELRKVSGYGWKGKLVVGWAAGRQVADGLEIRARQGEVYRLTAAPLRDDLFNRLLALGDQRWEVW